MDRLVPAIPHAPYCTFNFSTHNFFTGNRILSDESKCDVMFLFYQTVAARFVTMVEHWTTVRVLVTVLHSSLETNAKIVS